MPQTTLPGVARDEWLAPVAWGGLTVYCTGYAIHDGYTVYLSLIGRVTAVKAVWAAFLDHQTLPLPDEISLKRLPTDEETKYHTLKARLPETDWGHTVVVHSQATPDNLPERRFYVLSAGPEPPLHPFWAQWNQCQPYPSQPDWAAYLWRQGLDRQLISPCQSQGVYGWAVQPDETWAAIIAAGIQTGAIGP
jgi:hypothetical protein